MHILAAPDKFKGTASANDVAAAIAAAAEDGGHTSTLVPMADGGEGTLDVLGGANQTSSVTGPDGTVIDAQWRLFDGTAVIEMAQAAGLVLAGGREQNDPVAATSSGVGELICEAVDSGATRIIVGVGGSATTDGGLGAVEVIGTPDRLNGAEVVVACDVRTLFADAAAVFGPQKGATPAQVERLTDRLQELARTYKQRFGVNISDIASGGAAGGLAGGLAALGAHLVDGFRLIADVNGLSSNMSGVDLIVTGEGMLDEESFNGKVVGGVAEIAARHGVPVLAIAGQIQGDHSSIDTISLTNEFGLDRALNDTTAAIQEAVASYLASL